MGDFRFVDDPLGVFCAQHTDRAMVRFAPLGPHVIAEGLRRVERLRLERGVVLAVSRRWHSANRLPQ